MMWQTVVDARALVGRQPVLLALLAIGLFYGLYSEGFDRLWTAHLLETFPAPFDGAVGPVIWIGALRAPQALASLGAVELVRRRLDVGRAAALARTLMATTGAMVAGLVLFGLAPGLWVAAAAFLVVSTLRAVGGPLHETWYNRRIDDAQVRATLFSVTGQVDALGQIGGGPAVGAIGNASVRAALVVSAALLAPVIPLYRVAMRREEGG